MSDIQDIPKTVCKNIQAKQFIQRHPIFLTDVDYEYMLDEIERQDKIDLERIVGRNSDKEWYLCKH